MKWRRRQRSFFEDLVGGENFSWKRRRGVNKQTKKERLLLVVRPVGVVEGWSVSLEGGYRSVLPKVGVAKTPVVGVGEGHHSVSLQVVQCRRRSSSVAKKKKMAGRCRRRLSDGPCHQRPHSAVKSLVFPSTKAASQPAAFGGSVRYRQHQRPAL